MAINKSNEEINKAFELIENGVRSFLDSDNYKKYLSFLSKFHAYSLNNTILILSQRPDASLVAGYQAWKTNFNRQVNKGEKAMLILAPCQSFITHEVDKKDENGNILLDDSGKPIKETKEEKVLHFKTAKVFDIAQTSGEPIPEMIHDLRGSSKEIVALIESIQEISTIPITFKSSEEEPLFKSGVKGFYTPSTDSIVINKTMENMQIAKTLVHEYAHSRLHKDSNKTVDQKEIEAESLAFVICDHFNIDTSDYSFGYIGSYAQEDTLKLKTILSNIKNEAHAIIQTIEPIFQDKVLEMENYEALKTIASPILTGEAMYIKYQKSGFMDLNIENIGDNRIAMSQNYVMNGDLMADPDVEMIVDNKKQRVYPQTYQQDTLGIYQAVEHDPDLQSDLNIFMKDWLSNIKDNHFKVSEIHTEEAVLKISENLQKVRSFCKEHGIAFMSPKSKEQER